MALENFDNQACLCVWVRSLGDAKPLLQSLVTSIRGIVEAAMATYALTNNYTLDALKKTGLETSLEILNDAVAPVEAPLNTLVGYTAPFSDCPPVASLASAMKTVRDEVLSPVDDLRNKINQLSKAIDDSRSKMEMLNNILNFLDDISDAIDRC